MKVRIYKGFDLKFLNHIQQQSLVDTPIKDKIQITKFDNKYSRKLRRSLLDLEDLDLDEVWMTYQEFLLIQDQVLEGYAYKEYSLEILNNNIYMGYCQILDEQPDSVWDELIDLSIERKAKYSEQNSVFYRYYSDFYRAGQKIFGYLNVPDKKLTKITKDYYPTKIAISKTATPSIDHIYLNDDMESFLFFVSQEQEEYPQYVSFQKADNMITDKMLESLKAWAVLHGVKLEHLEEEADTFIPVSSQLANIAREDLCISQFSQFRDLTFYKQPELSNETVQISQGQIVSEIIEQSEIAYEEPAMARDLFITAPTGSGKSLMFQIPAAYLAKKYGKLTLVIEPIKALMQDQITQLKQRGYDRVETFNSDLISQNEKEEVLRRVKSGEVDILYISPETLLSYSIQMLIGDRKVGLIVVDEAHIVTTWGMDFGQITGIWANLSKESAPA